MPASAAAAWAGGPEDACAQPTTHSPHRERAAFQRGAAACALYRKYCTGPRPCHRGSWSTRAQAVTTSQITKNDPRARRTGTAHMRPARGRSLTVAMCLVPPAHPWLTCAVRGGRPCRRRSPWFSPLALSPPSYRSPVLPSSIPLSRPSAASPSAETVSGLRLERHFTPATRTPLRTPSAPQRRPRSGLHSQPPPQRRGGGWRQRGAERRAGKGRPAVHAAGTGRGADHGRGRPYP